MKLAVQLSVLAHVVIPWYGTVQASKRSFIKFHQIKKNVHYRLWNPVSNGFIKKDPSDLTTLRCSGGFDSADYNYSMCAFNVCFFVCIAHCLQHRASVGWDALCGWAQCNNDREQQKHSLTIKKRKIFQMFRKQENNGRKFAICAKVLGLKINLHRFIILQNEDTELIRTTV